MGWLDPLPSHLAERCKVHEGPDAADPEFVLHWMRTSIRLEESATFDVARTLANHLDLPLIILHAIDERYPHASYRLHRFLLEGAADVQAQAERIGTRCLLHVARDSHRRPVVRDLSARAAVVVTDLADLPPWRVWTESVLTHRTVIQVDAHCILPRPVFGRSLDRPFRFRDATRRDLRRRATCAWPPCDLPLPSGEHLDLGIESVDARALLMEDGGASLLRSCRIDPCVVATPSLPGGTSAGLRRWNAYLSQGLSTYHRTRNDASRPEGVSGMSPYLHFGMVAATRVARDAHEHKGKGAEKFLDELLVFREHAQHHVHAVDDPASWHHLPMWARASWERTVRVGASRPVADLERGRTGDPLWDAAQRGLLRHGVMHNNVRMTWGKATVRWLDPPEVAMEQTLAMNDRYALDGRDASSIAGVQWCFGLFDRPFEPFDPRVGHVRRRPTEDHARRIDLDRFRAWTEAPTLEARRVVSFDRGSPAAAIAALLLSDLGHAVTVPDAGWVFDGDPFVRAPTTGMRILLDDAVGRGRFISEQDGLRLVDPTGWWADVMAEASVDQAATHHWEAPDFDELGDALDAGTRWVSELHLSPWEVPDMPAPGQTSLLAFK